MIGLEHAYAAAVPDLSLPWRAAPVTDPEVVAVNDALSAELGLDPDWLRSPDAVAFLTGHAPDVDGRAQAYAGHQFGKYSPRLGDGRALLLGEVVDPSGRRRDLHLKGSGRTPFSRGGDGFAALGPMLRELVVGEAMHALGVPTTRALAVVATGNPVQRETLLPGAVLCRVAASHLRVGTFQYAAATGDRATLQALADHAIDRHHPAARDADNPALALLEAVASAQAELVARWMLVGFIHGVLNTDNVTISGEAIDFGPCAFMEAYDPATVFSLIDHHGRYAYGNQPVVTQWNLARFAEALLPLVAEKPDDAIEPAMDVLRGFAEHYEAAYARGLAAKLGLDEPDPTLQADLLALLEAGRVDHTTFFRGLADGSSRDLFDDPEVVTRFDAWADRREALLPADRAGVAEAMNRVNPAIVPRNHRVEDALAAATAGDLAPVTRLVDAVRRPFDPRPDDTDLAAAGPGDAEPYVTYCGT
ncbi:YdiU family protein [Mariniluteicoccus flavus]